MINIITWGSVSRVWSVLNLANNYEIIELHGGKFHHVLSRRKREGDETLSFVFASPPPGRERLQKIVHKEGKRTSPQTMASIWKTRVQPGYSHRQGYRLSKITFL